MVTWRVRRVVIGAVLVPRGLWDMKVGPSGWQWINKLKLRGSIQVSMETLREVVWAMFLGAFCKATERCSGWDPHSCDGTKGAALAEPLPAPHLPRMRPKPLLLSLHLVTESVSTHCQGLPGHLGREAPCVSPD